MSSRALSHLAVAAFVVLGIVSFGTRYWTRHEVRTAREASLWRLAYQIDVHYEQPATPNPGAAIVRIAIPTKNHQYQTLVSEEIVHGDLKAEEDPAEPEDPSEPARTRDLDVTLDREGDYRITSEFEILLNPRGRWLSGSRSESLSANRRTYYLRDTEEAVPARSDAARDVLQAAPTGTDGEVLQWIFDFCSRDIQSNPNIDDASQALRRKEGTPLARARAMVALCRTSRIPARLVTGFDLKQGDNIVPHVWVEVFRGHSWVPFDPEFGFARYLPPTMIPIRWNGDTLIRPLGNQQAQVEATYSIRRLRPPQTVLMADKSHPAQILDLTRLPVSMHDVMKLMLLLPVAALITAIFRNFVGIQTYGTFAPALLAMSFIYAAWVSGLVTLIVVVAAGLFGRSFLERLRLLMVPRLSIILTTIILFVTFGVSLLDYVGRTPSAEAVLLPMVILTTMIERVYLTKEEDGVLFAVQLALGTIVVATFCYLLLRWDQVGEIMLTYPELHFFTIAAFIMLGRYAGYRITELWRFRDLSV